MIKSLLRSATSAGENHNGRISLWVFILEINLFSKKKKYLE